MLTFQQPSVSLFHHVADTILIEHPVDAGEWQQRD